MLHIPSSRGQNPSFILTVQRDCVCLAAVQSTYINMSQHPSASGGIGDEPWREKLQSWREKLRWGSPKFTLRQCRTVFFLSQADFLLFKWKSGYSSLQFLSPYSTSGPFASAPILPCHHPGPSAARISCCIATRQDYMDSCGKMPRNFNTSGKSDLASQAHTLFLLSLFSLVKGSIIPPNSALGWGQSRKFPNAKSF